MRISDWSSDVCSSDLDFRVGDEGDAGAAAVRRRTQFLEPAKRGAARKTLAIEQLVARDLDHRVGRQGVDDADPDTMEAARRRIGLAFELPARMEHRHEDRKSTRLNSRH